MEISALNAVSSASAAANSEAVTDANSDYEFFGQYDEIERENRMTNKATKEKVTQNLKAMKSKIELHDNWYHFIIGDDYIKLKGDGKLTYGDLREKFGIPPRALSQTNSGNFKDSDIVRGSVEIKLEDMGWFERRMDEMEAADARAQRNYGNYFAGWERTLTNDEIIKILSE